MKILLAMYDNVIYDVNNQKHISHKKILINVLNIKLLYYFFKFIHLFIHISGCIFNNI